MENNTLVIERVKKDDEGLYECRASNDLGQDSTSAFIKIQGEARAEGMQTFQWAHSGTLDTFLTWLYIDLQVLRRNPTSR